MTRCAPPTRNDCASWPAQRPARFACSAHTIPPSSSETAPQTEMPDGVDPRGRALANGRAGELSGARRVVDVSGATRQGLGRVGREHGRLTLLREGAGDPFVPQATLKRDPVIAVGLQVHAESPGLSEAQRAQRALAEVIPPEAVPARSIRERRRAVALQPVPVADGEDDLLDWCQRDLDREPL